MIAVPSLEVVDQGELIPLLFTVVQDFHPLFVCKVHVCKVQMCKEQICKVQVSKVQIYKVQVSKVQCEFHGERHNEGELMLSCIFFENLKVC